MWFCLLVPTCLHGSLGQKCSSPCDCGTKSHWEEARAESREWGLSGLVWLQLLSMGPSCYSIVATISWAWAPHSLGPKHLCYPTQRSLLRQVSASACLSQEWSLPGTVCLLYTYVLFCCLVALPSCSPQQSLWYDLHLLPRHFNKVFKVSLKKKRSPQHWFSTIICYVGDCTVNKRKHIY